ncbi:uncharacterized protein [Branchiostoma lanceolatum]|uniref:uncharacterized protein n=1 Tax=Branchiostoma lanceolatum TaxID=7740 RepID=UPI003452AF92
MKTIFCTFYNDLFENVYLHFIQTQGFSVIFKRDISGPEDLQFFEVATIIPRFELGPQGCTILDSGATLEFPEGCVKETCFISVEIEAVPVNQNVRANFTAMSAVLTVEQDFPQRFLRPVTVRLPWVWKQPGRGQEEPETGEATVILHHNRENGWTVFQTDLQKEYDGVVFQTDHFHSFVVATLKTVCPNAVTLWDFFWNGYCENKVYLILSPDKVYMQGNVDPVWSFDLLCVHKLDDEKDFFSSGYALAVKQRIVMNNRERIQASLREGFDLLIDPRALSSLEDGIIFDYPPSDRNRYSLLVKKKEDVSDKDVYIGQVKYERQDMWGNLQQSASKINDMLVWAYPRSQASNQHLKRSLDRDVFESHPKRFKAWREDTTRSSDDAALSKDQLQVLKHLLTEVKLKDNEHLKNYPRLEAHVFQSGLTFRGVIPKDGNCMFHAVCDQVFRTEGRRITHLELRTQVVSHLRTNPYNVRGDHIGVYVPNQSWEEYLDTMSRPGTWGDHVVLQAVADMLGHDVTIVSSVEADNYVTVLHPQSGFPPRATRPLLLGHYAENHYASLDDVSRYFHHIKENVTAEWKDLAYQLGFSRPDVDTIDERNNNYKSRCLDMLGEWQKGKGKTVTTEVLMEALKDLRLLKTLHDLKRKYPELDRATTEQSATK